MMKDAMMKVAMMEVAIVEVAMVDVNRYRVDSITCHHQFVFSLLPAAFAAVGFLNFLPAAFAAVGLNFFSNREWGGLIV